MKNKKRVISSIVIAIAAILCIVIAFTVYNVTFRKPYSGNGIYYSQKGDGKYMQFLNDKTFSYISDPQKAVNADKTTDSSSQATVLGSGTWKQSGNKIIIQFTDSENTITFIEKDGYLYREDTVFRGITSDAKLLKNKYLLEKNDEQRIEAWFFDDGTMSYDEYWGKDLTTKSGTYTRVDDILVVRYDKTPDVAHKFLVLENGISEDLFSRELPQ